MKDADAMVFVVDDDSSIREANKSLLNLAGLRIENFRQILCGPAAVALDSADVTAFRFGVEFTTAPMPSKIWSTVQRLL